MILWQADPILLSAGPIQIRWYGLLFSLAFLSGWMLMRWMYRREGHPIDVLESLLVYVIGGTIIGARLGHTLIYEPEIYLADPIRILKVWEGGLASHGAVIGVLTAVYLFSRRNRELGFLALLDRLTMPCAISAALVRLGNLFNSELYGKPTDVPWAFTFAHVDSIPRHPTQLYESLAYFLVLAIMIQLYKKKAASWKPGRLFGAFLALSFIFRFILEYFKAPQNELEKVLVLDYGQLLSIPFILTGLFLIWWKRPDQKRN